MQLVASKLSETKCPVWVNVVPASETRVRPRFALILPPWFDIIKIPVSCQLRFIANWRASKNLFFSWPQNRQPSINNLILERATPEVRPGKTKWRRSRQSTRPLHTSLKLLSVFIEDQISAQLKSNCSSHVNCFNWLTFVMVVIDIKIQWLCFHKSQKLFSDPRLRELIILLFSQRFLILWCHKRASSF